MGRKEREVALNDLLQGAQNLVTPLEATYSREFLSRPYRNIAIEGLAQGWTLYDLKDKVVALSSTPWPLATSDECTAYSLIHSHSAVLRSFL